MICLRSCVRQGGTQIDRGTHRQTGGHTYIQGTPMQTEILTYRHGIHRQTWDTQTELYIRRYSRGCDCTFSKSWDTHTDKRTHRQTGGNTYRHGTHRHNSTFPTIVEGMTALSASHIMRMTLHLLDIVLIIPILWVCF
jgi:hypothetical protein